MTSIVRCDTYEALLKGVWEIDNPHCICVVTCVFLAILTFVVSSATGNLSQVDKLWSIVPALYAWTCVVDARTGTMAGLSTLWSARLTYNFYRRGGYAWPPWRGEEDYRWPYIRKGLFFKALKNRALLLAFNFFFVSAYQNVLLLLMASPSLVSWSASMDPTCRGGEVGWNPALNAIDGIAVFLFVFSLFVEATADNQQYEFQTNKHEKKRAGETLTGEYSDGFLQSGLFAIVRKPNYAAEQIVWFSYYLFSVAATGRIWNWSAWGISSLVLLFQGSGWLTEKITMEKYPKYVSHKREVPLYVPSLPVVIRALKINISGTSAPKKE